MEQTILLAEARATATFAELGVADALEDGPRSAKTIAAQVGVDPVQLDRLLRFLASRGVVGHDGDRFQLTAVSDLLRRNHPQSVRDWITFQGADWQWQAWECLTEGVREADATPFEIAHHQRFFDLLQSDPSAGTQFDAAMRSTSRLQAELISRAIDLEDVARVCDVGGGTATILCRLLRDHDHLHGTLLDLPAVVARASQVVDEEGLGDRIEIVSGDMFEQVPSGADRYLLSAIIHDWPDDQAVRILRNVSEAMTDPEARAIVVELELPDHDGAALERSYDLLMLVLGGGRERTRPEFLALFETAGLRITDDVILGNGWHAYHLGKR